MEKNCTKCGCNIHDQVEEGLAKLLDVCPKCSGKDVVKLSYKMFGKNKGPRALRDKK